MNNIVAAIEYDGTMFQGSQKQPNSRTVQGSFDDSLLKIHKKQILSEFASRTDSGVHASNQVVSFKTDLNIDSNAWVQTLNHYLPLDIRVFKCEKIIYAFDVRRDAIKDAQERQAQEQAEAEQQESNETEDNSTE